MALTPKLRALEWIGMGSREVFDAASHHLRDNEIDEATPQFGRRQ
jgi:hypothetical protein